MAAPPSPSFETLAAEALSHHAAGRLADAEGLYRRALALQPVSPALLQNLAAVLAAQGRHVEALPLFDQALDAEPRYAVAHFNRAATLEALARIGDAIAAYRTAAAIEPAHYDAHRRLAFLYLARGERGRALDRFARTYELRRGDDHTTFHNRSLTHTCHAKLLHDAAQFRYLAARHRDARRFELLARCYEDLARSTPPGRDLALTAAHRDQIGEDYNTAINVYGAAELPGPAISPTLDAAAITADVHTRGATIIDDLLTQPALDRFRRYLLESTVWHDANHIGGFVASYLEDGLASPLLLQIVTELREALPDLLADKPLTQAWAFKGVTQSSRINLHSDDAALSLNFWITPDAANLTPERGGLVVYLTPPPDDWQVAGYRRDDPRLMAFAAENSESTWTIPYRANRAVLFRSRLVHGSDRPSFADGYENHRINVTLLFAGAA